MLIAANHPLKSTITTQTGLQQLNVQLVKFKLKLESHPTSKLRSSESWGEFHKYTDTLEIEFALYIWFYTNTAALFFISNGKKIEYC